MTALMSTLAQVRARTVRKLLMLHPLMLPRSQRKPNQKMMLMVPVAEGSTSHLKAQPVRVHLGLPQRQSNLHNILKIPAAERSTSHLEAQLVRVHLGLLPS